MAYNTCFSTWCISIVFLNCSSFTAIVLRRAQYGLDVSSSWIISIRGWSPWVSATVWIVLMCMTGQSSLRSFRASLTNSTSEFLRWNCQAVNLVASVFYIAEHYISTRQSPPPSCFDNDRLRVLPCAKHMHMISVFSGACAHLRLRDVGFAGFASDGRPEELSFDSLFRVKTMKRTNQIEFYGMWCATQFQACNLMQVNHCECPHEQKKLIYTM
jgi:hypothetical protein